MNGNADALSRNAIDNNKEEPRPLQVYDNDTFMTPYEKITTKKIFTGNKREKSKNEVKPLKLRNLNLVIAPDDIYHFSGTSKAEI